jgi:aminocarboxymuconate-semialdehyde decarboxylase
MTVVDVHTHFAPPALPAQMRRDGGFVVTPDGLRLPVHYAELHDPAAKLQELDARGIDAAVVSLTPHLFAYGEDAAAFARHANDALAEYVSASPRLSALATLPINDPDAAAAELDRCMGELDFAGAQIGTSLPDGRPLDGLWEAAADVPLVLHPYYAGPIADPDLFLNNSVGVPLDTCLAAARLLCDGTLDRHPRLRLVLVHGGGHLPFQLGRLDNAWRMRPAERRAAKPPSGYLDRFHFDTIVHSPDALRFLAGLVGADRLLLGTDLPYVTAEQRPVEHARAAGLDPHALGANAAALFSLRSAPDRAVPASAGPRG